MYTAAAQQALLIMFGVVAACFILAWPAYRIVSMWLMKELTGFEAIAAMVVLLAFLAGIMTTWGRLINLLLWLLLLSLAGIIWFGGRKYDAVRLDGFFRKDVAASERALARDPDNAAAHMRLGDLSERSGDLDRAIHHFEQVCRLVRSDSEARLRLASVIERRRRSALGDLVCWRCGTENAGTAVHCRACGVLISDRNQLIEFLTTSTLGRAIPWLAASCLLLAVAGSLIRQIPLSVTVLSYLLLFAAVLCYVYPRWCRART